MPVKVECDQCSMLKACPFLPLDSNERNRLHALQNAWQVRKNRVIYVTGEVADSMYVLCSGSVKLVVDSGTQHRLTALIKPGDWFGLDAFLPQRRRRFTAISRGNSVVCCIERACIDELADGNTEILWRLVTMLSVQLHAAEEGSVLLRGAHVRRRLLNVLALCNANSIALSQVELADFLGISAETICRELRALRERADLKHDRSA